jgi:ribosomal protein S18 acetylase RimI-like enzyme
MITIRKAKIEDAKDIARIHIDTWKKAYNGIIDETILNKLDPIKREKFFSKVLSDANHEFYVAVYDDVVAGFTAFGLSRDDDKGLDCTEIKAIYVDPHFWNKKIGKGLLMYAIEKLSLSTEISLWVLKENERAISFYHSFEFQPDGTEKTLESLGNIVEVRLVKQLSN